MKIKKTKEGGICMEERNQTKKEKIMSMIIPACYIIAIIGAIVIKIITKRTLYSLTFATFWLGSAGIYTFLTETNRKLPVFTGALEIGSIVVFIKLIYIIYYYFIK